MSEKSCQARIDKAQREVEPRGVGCVPMYGCSLGLAALGAGELYDAAERLQNAWELALRQGIHNPNVFPIAGDLAEALARAGESDRCRQILNWLDERAQATGLAYPRAVASGRGESWQPTPKRRSAYSLNPSPHWTRSAQSHSNEHAPSCAPGRRCAATAVLSLHVSRSIRLSYFSRVSARDHGRLALGPN